MQRRFCSARRANLHDGHKLVETHPSVYVEATENDIHLPHTNERLKMSTKCSW